MPIFGPGGQMVAAIELALGELGQELRPMVAALAIASRSLGRELAGDARPTPSHRIPQPRTARPTVEQATTLMAEAAG